MSCQTEYFLPWADLSFFYGTFLGVTRRGEVAVLDSFSDPVFDEVSMLVKPSKHCSPRWA